MSENEITKSILEYLHWNKIFAWRQNTSPIYDTVTGGYRRMPAGSLKGVSDILGCYKGKMLAIECKTVKGKLSKHQKEFIDNVNKAGGIGFVARNLEDVEKNLTTISKMSFSV